MEKSLIDQLNADYSVAVEVLNVILSSGKLNQENIILMLNLENLTVVAEFLERYEHFEAQDLNYIKTFITQNLSNKDRLFVSDLIEFARIREIELPYQECIEMIPFYENDDTYVQLAVISYLFENLKMKYIDQLFNGLSCVLNNPECNQSVQIKAALFLFRISHKKEFLTDLIDLVVNGDENYELLHSLLEMNYNSENYFDYHSLLKSILPY